MFYFENFQFWFIVDKTKAIALSLDTLQAKIVEHEDLYPEG